MAELDIGTHERPWGYFEGDEFIEVPKRPIQLAFGDDCKPPIAVMVGAGGRTPRTILEQPDPSCIVEMIMPAWARHDLGERGLFLATTPLRFNGRRFMWRIMQTPDDNHRPTRVYIEFLDLVARARWLAHAGELLALLAPAAVVRGIEQSDDLPVLRSSAWAAAPWFPVPASCEGGVAQIECGRHIIPEESGETHEECSRACLWLATRKAHLPAARP